MMMNRDSQADWPELRLMTSTGLPANNTPGNGEAREPTGNEVSFTLPRLRRLCSVEDGLT